MAHDTYHAHGADRHLSFAGPDVESFAAELVEQATSRVPYDSDTNPVAERQLGTVKRATMAALAYAGAPAVLWPWAVSQYEHIRHFISTEAIQPPMSPYMLAHPEASPANLSWAKPLFCDVTVHLPSRDSQGKLAYTGSDACRVSRRLVCPEMLDDHLSKYMHLCCTSTQELFATAIFLYLDSIFVR